MGEKRRKAPAHVRDWFGGRASGLRLSLWQRVPIPRVRSTSRTTLARGHGARFRCGGCWAGMSPRAAARWHRCCGRLRRVDRPAARRMRAAPNWPPDRTGLRPPASDARTNASCHAGFARAMPTSRGLRLWSDRVAQRGWFVRIWRGVLQGACGAVRSGWGVDRAGGKNLPRPGGMTGRGSPCRAPGTPD